MRDISASKAVCAPSFIKCLKIKQATKKIWLNGYLMQIIIGQGMNDYVHEIHTFDPFLFACCRCCCCCYCYWTHENWFNSLETLAVRFLLCLHPKGGCDVNLTIRFQIAVRLFSNRSQMMSKWGKNKKVAPEAQPSVSLMFLPHFDVTCDLLRNKQTHGSMESICFI